MFLKLQRPLPFVLLMLCFSHLRILAAFSVAEDWSTYVGGNSGSHSVLASAMGENGRVYISGYSYNGSIVNDDGIEYTEYPGDAAANDGFVAQVTSSGNLLWYSILGAAGDDEVRGVAVHGGSVFAAARFARTEVGNQGSEAVLYSLSKTDGSFNWSHPVVIGGGQTTNAFNAVVVDTNGYIYAVGTTSSIGLTPAVAGYQVNGSGPLYGNALKGNLDGFVVKISPAGAVQWVHYLGGANVDRALTCTIGTNGFLYVGGETGSAGWVSHNPGNITPTASNKAGFVVKLRTDGTHIWSTYLGGSQSDSVAGLAFEKISGQLFAAGTTGSSNFMSAKPRLNSYGGGASDGFVTSISDSGPKPTVNWSKFYGSNQTDVVTSIQQLDNSQMVLGGSTSAGAWLPECDNAFHGAIDGFVVTMSVDGESQWSRYIGGTKVDQTLTVAAANGVFYAGGLTLSDGNWVSGGFRNLWYDEYNIELAGLGFLAKYVSSGYIPDPPTITTQPQSTSVEEGKNAIFTVEAQSAEALFYQWRVNAAPIAAATNIAFAINHVTLAQDGDEITCVVSNLAGSVVSEIALLTVTAIPMGWVKMELAPAAAVSNGVAWSLNAGATWHLSGEVVNLLTGVYAIVYRDVFGWAKPATPFTTTVLNLQTNSLAAAYTAISYNNARYITGTNIVVIVTPPDGTEDWTLREVLPVGLTPYAYPVGTVWNPGTRTLRYIGYETTPMQFSYSVTGAVGSYQLSGLVNYYPSGDVTTVGATQVTIAVLPPPVIPDPDIIGFVPQGALPGSFLLQFISILDQSYLIETNGAPRASGWAKQGQVNGSANQTEVSVPASEPALFYRVRVP